MLTNYQVFNFIESNFAGQTYGDISFYIIYLFDSSKIDTREKLKADYQFYMGII